MTDTELTVWLKLRMKGADGWGSSPCDFEELHRQFTADWPAESPTKPAVKLLLKHALEIGRGLQP